MSYTVPKDAIAAEKLRHEHLSTISDPESKRIIAETGIQPGWHCLEVGAGSCLVAMHLAQAVGENGSVTATDIDTRLAEMFVPKPPPQLKILKHDILEDDLPQGHYHLVHSRALLEHLPDPEKGLQRMHNSLRPGGWLITECSDFTPFEQQELNGPFAELVEKMAQMREGSDTAHKGHLGRRLLNMMNDLDLKDVQVRGHVWQMQAKQPTLEWLLIALEWGIKDILGAELVDAALEQARSDDFSALSPLHISVWGQLPE